MSGFCFVTFNEHSAAVTGVIFTPNSQVVLSSSLDGTIRAFDLNRYVMSISPTKNNVSTATITFFHFQAHT